MTTLAIDQKLVRNPELPFAEMDGEIVIMSVENGDYYAVGGVGVKAWGLLQEPTTLAEMVDMICLETGVAPATCSADLDNFLSDLLDRDLIMRV